MTFLLFQRTYWNLSVLEIWQNFEIAIAKMKQKAVEVNVDTIKTNIRENQRTLLIVLEISDLFLIELVGEEVLDEPDKEKILAGGLKSEINQRFLEWLLNTENSRAIEIFLAKLREFEQRHVANLLDGTPGELPLNQKDRLNMQKMMRDLTKRVDPGSGLLDELLSLNAISKEAYDRISEEQTRPLRAKQLLDTILQGSDKAYRTFCDTLLKIQPEVAEILSQKEGINQVLYGNLVNKHLDILKRCTDVNVFTVAILRSNSVIDAAMESRMNSENDSFQRIVNLYTWLKFQPNNVFEDYLKAMEENEQKHVANLLRNNTTGQQPLSDQRFARLTKIRPQLMKQIHNPANLADSLRAKQATEDSDFAISFSDCEEIKQGVKPQHVKSKFLIDAICRRTDFTFDSFEEVLRDAHHDKVADYLTEGEIIGAHINTTQPDKEDDLSKLFNEKISCPGTDQVLTDSFNELKSYNLHLVAAEAQHSIMAYIYCRKPEDATTYIKLLNSGHLQTIFRTILNQLLKANEPEHHHPLEIAVTLEEEDKKLIQEFTGMDGTQSDIKDLPFISKESCKLHDKPMDVYCFDCKTVLCSSCIVREHQLHRHSDTATSAADQLRKQLEQDLISIENFKSNEIRLKSNIEKQEEVILKQVEKSEIAIKKKCEDLKEKVEKFKEVLLKEHADYKEKILHDFGTRKKAIESFVAVFKDYEVYAKQVMERKTAVDIYQYDGLHKRAENLQMIASQKTASAANTEESVKNLPQFCAAFAFPVNDLRRIKLHETFLQERMDSDFGLLEQLHALGVLSDHSMGAVLKLATTKERNRKILEIVIKENKYMELLQALSQTRQTHLLNYLKGNGAYYPQFGDDWPLEEEHFIILDAMRDSLLYLFDKDNRAPLATFFITNIITVRQEQFISSKKTSQEKVDALLNLLKCSSVINFKGTLSVLRAFQVLYQEMPKPNPIVQHRKFLENWMCLDFELVEKQLPLSRKESRWIKSERTREKKNAKLLEIVSTETSKCSNLLKILRDVNQAHIVNFLITDGLYDRQFGEDWPINQIMADILDHNQKHLVEKKAFCDHSRLEILENMHVITKKQKETISHLHSFRERNRELLILLRYGSIRSYNTMIYCLHETNQSEIAGILMPGCVNPVLGQVNVTLKMNFVKPCKEETELLSSVNELQSLRFPYQQP